MLLNRQGQVFVGKRIDQTVEGWQMPQGGIDAGEEPRIAALRELQEETGTNNAKIIAEMENWVTYDLPPHLVGIAFHGKYRGQRQKWFALRFSGQEREIDPLIPRNGQPPEFDQWRWERLDRVADLVVPFRRDVYRSVAQSFAAFAG